MLLNRTEYIPASKKPTVDAFAKTLVEKYGTPTELPPDSPVHIDGATTAMERCENPPPQQAFVGCPRLKPGAVEFQPLGSSADDSGV